MKIAFDQQMFVNQRYGGISRYVVRLAEQLHDKGENVKIFAPLHVNEHLRDASSSLVFGHAFKHKYWKKGFHNASALFARPAIAAWRPDVVHETYYSKHRSAPKSCPTVLTVHDMIHEIYSSEFKQANSILSDKQSAISRADKIICVSQSTKNDLLRLTGLKPEKVSVVLHGYDIKNVSHNGPYAVESPFLLYVGQRGGYKNFDGLLKAYALSNQLKHNFKIIAFGGEKFKPEHANQIASHGIKPKQVEFRSGDDKELSNLYQQAAAFIYPSFYEGFGLPPLEAMANNCAIASSNTSSMPEVIGNAAAFFDPSHPDEMATAIESIVFDAARKQQFITLGHERLKYFSWEKCAKETLEIYRELK
jgi:glycosyltransferase involved in cell wall biosynthesis